MVALGDMPLVDLAHLEALRRCFEGSGMVCSSIGPARSPPAIFPIAAREQLMTFVGDQGARILLADAICVPGNDSILMDIDSMAAAESKSLILSLDEKCTEFGGCCGLPTMSIGTFVCPAPRDKVKIFGGAISQRHRLRHQ